ncbi:hypothetical protein GCM10020331_092980 [Ectobacillus funiculus]
MYKKKIYSIIWNIIRLKVKTPIYHKETNTFLYQSFIHATTKEIARVMEITQEGIVRTKTERGTFLQLDELLEQGYVASGELKSMKAINKKRICPVYVRQTESAEFPHL